MLDKAREIILQVEELQHLADSQRAPLSFPMTVGVIPTICPYLLPRSLPILHDRHPQARLNIVEDQSQELVEMVSRGEIDTAILALPYPCDGLLSMEFWQEDFYWVALEGAENTLMQMVLGKLGTTLIPEMALDQLISQHEELAAVHLNESGPHRRIAFLMRPNYTRTSSIDALMGICREALTSQCQI